MLVILLVGHGSKDPQGNQEFLRFVDMTKSLAKDIPIEHCFLEFERPNVQDGIEICVRRGAKKILLFPIMLFAASHVKTDIPNEMKTAAQRYPGLQFKIGSHLDLDRLLLEIVLKRITELPISGDRGEFSVLLVGRGTHDSEANADLYRIARILWEEAHFQLVETCFIGLTFPDLREGITRCIRLGARKILVVPYMIFTGKLVKRISTIADEMRALNPTVNIYVANHIGPDKKLVNATATKIRETWASHSEGSRGYHPGSYVTAPRIANNNHGVHVDRTT